MAENNPDMATTVVSSSKLAMAEKDPDMGTTAVTSSLRLKAGYGWINPDMRPDYSK